MRGIAVALLLLFAPACHAVLSLEPPPATQDGSLMLVVWEDGQLRAIYAIEAGAVPRYPRIPVHRGVRTYALMTYACPLSTMGFSVGSLALLDAPAAVLRIVPPNEIYQSTLDKTKQSPWEKQA